jgi:ABC-type phosphate transport system substrate-binding protein
MMRISKFEWVVKKGLVFVSAFFLLSSISTSSFAQNESQEQISVIANPESATSISKRDILFIFTGLISRWPNGVPITVVMLPINDSTTELFCRDILNSYPYQIEAILNKKRIMGEDISRIIVNNNQEMISIVEHTKGAIGYGFTKNQNLILKIINK